MLSRLQLSFLGLLSASRIKACWGTEERKRNVILIIADDLGVRDLGCYNPEEDNRFYETPNLDRLASEGALFENAYSADSTCPRSRAGLFTGIHPARLGVIDTARLETTGFIDEFWCFRKLTPDNKQIVPLPAFTMAEAFQANGYTTVLVGKWHSGNATAGFPLDHGFDMAIGNATNLNTFYAPYECGQSKCNKEPVPSNLSTVPEGTHMTDHLTMGAIALLESFQDKEEPFFMALSHYAVHTPIESKNEDRSYFAKKPESNSSRFHNFEIVDGLYERTKQVHPTYAGMLKGLDDSVGNLTEALERLGLADNTIILFTSDNGGKAANWNEAKFKTCLTSNKPFKQAKEYIGDGGIRVPLLIRAPGLVEPNTRLNYQSHGMDYYPTLLDLAGLPLLPDIHVDGKSLLPALEGGDPIQRDEPMFWQDPAECWRIQEGDPHNCTDTSFAVIEGSWKLLKRIYGGMDYSLELYNLESDPGERINLATQGNGMGYRLVEDSLHDTLENWIAAWFDTPFYKMISSEYEC